MAETLNEERFQQMFDYVTQMNAQTLKKLVDEGGMLKYVSSIFPSKTKALSKNYFKDLYEIKDTRTLVLVAHLYWEHIINAMIKENFKYYKEILNFRFHQKLKLLRANNTLDKDLFNDLTYVNNIRNKFAHNLNYDASLIDMSKFAKLSTIYQKKKYKLKSNQRRLNHLLLLMYCQYLLMVYSEKYPLIYHLEIEI